MARLMRPFLSGAFALALAACGSPSDIAGTEDATVTPAAAVAPALDAKAAADAAKAKDLADKLAAEKPAFDAATGDPVQLDALAEAGNGWALFHRAQERLATEDYMLQQGGFTDMELAAEKGVAGAQLWVGQRMAFGKDGYKLQPSSGLKMMEKAAAQGNVDAILAVAAMYVQDVYMHDDRKARDWYKRAADLGSAEAKSQLDKLNAEAGSPLAP